MICPGPCNEAHRRALAGGRPAPEGDPREGSPVWCRPCQSTILAAIESLPGLAAGLFQLGHRTGQIARPADVNSGGSKGTRVHAPTASPAWEAIDEILQWSVRVERELREHLAQPQVSPWKSGTTEGAAARLRQAVLYLMAWATPLLCAPWADELWEVVRLAKRAERASGLDRHVERLLVACSRCEKPRLVRHDGSDDVHCRACGHVSTLARDCV